MILLDTSVLVDSLTGPRALLPRLLRALATDERIALSTIVVYEWLRGPRTLQELSDQEDLIPAALALTFDHEDARIAAGLYRTLRRARSREADIAIAACAIRHEARLWTLRAADFADIPGLTLYNPQGV